MKKQRVRALIGFVCGALAAVTSTTASAGTVVTVLQGKIEGVQQKNVTAFLGIPYAAPPIGQDRWKSPRPAPHWNGVRAADKFGNSCFQAVDPKGFGPWSHEYVVQGKASEDCLFVNVWTPAHLNKRDREKLPVLVWIHGGGFVNGSASVPIYDGSALAARGVVIVSLNYRLGALGFLAHPDLTREAGKAPPANFGLQDQVAALRWVRDNIRSFGGDPAKVTIAGQSAGAMSVHSMVSTPLARGLFRGAIAQSGLPSIGRIATLSEAERAGEVFALSKGARSIAELRKLSPEQLMDANPQAIRFGAVVDGKLLPESPTALLAEGKIADVPMIVGLTTDDPGSLAHNYGSGDEAAYNATLAAKYGAFSAEAAPLYPAATAEQRSHSSKDILRDFGRAAIDEWARTRAAHVSSPVYAYVFDHVEPGPDAARYGAFHSSEIPYVFGTLDSAPERGFSSIDQLLSAQIGELWLNFVKNQVPVGDRLPLWSRFESKSPQILRLGSPIEIQPLLPSAKLDLLRKVAASGAALSIL